MANIQDIITNINYGQEDYEANPVFILKPNSLFFSIVEESDEATILKYAAAFQGIGTEQYTLWEKLTQPTQQLEADKEFGDYVRKITNAISAPKNFILNYLENRDTAVNSVISVPHQTTKLIAASFSDAKAVRLLENGFGKSLKWCKIVIKIGQDKYGIAITTRDAIQNIVKNRVKDRIDDQFDSILNTPELIPKLYPSSNYSLSPSQKASTEEIEKSYYSSEIAAYIGTYEVDIDRFDVDDNIIVEKFTNTLKYAVVNILKNANRFPTLNEASFIDLFYSFAKIESYYINPRRGIKPKILVSIPYRNIIAVTESDREIIESLHTVLVDGPQRLQNALNSVSGKEIFNFDKFAPNITNALAGGPNAGLKLDYVSEADKLFSDDPSSKKYVDRDEFTALENRKVTIPLRDLPKVGEKFVAVLDSYTKKLVEELDKNDDNKTQLDLSLYRRSAEQYFKIIGQLRAEAFLKIDSGSIDKYCMIFQYKSGALETIFCYGEDRIVLLEGSEQFVRSSLFSDQTFRFFSTNILSLYEVEPDKKSITEFLSEYVTPKELAKIEYASGTTDRFVQRELECLRTYKNNLTNQLKINTNEFANNIISAETIKNTKANFDKTEYQKLADQIKAINAQTLASSVDLKTIQWDSIINEIVGCIQDKEIRELILLLLKTLKDFFVFDIPLACQIPVVTLPRFPVVRLPTIPHVPSIVASYYANFGRSLVAARTDMILLILKGIFNLFDICQLSTDPSKAGETKADDLLDPYTQISQAQNSREGQFKSAGIAKNSIETDEVALLLADISRYLTESELVRLFYGLPDQITLSIVKSRITSLEADGTLRVIMPEFGEDKKLHTDNKTQVTILIDNKVIFFFAKFGKITNESAVARVQQNISTVDLLCIETSELDNKNKDALLEKGLSEEQALQEIQRRKDEAARSIAELAVGLSLLGKAQVEGPPINCVKNPDGTITPGLSDKAGRPKAFTMGSERLVDKMYAPFEEAYNDNISDWPTLTEFRIYETKLYENKSQNFDTGSAYMQPLQKALDDRKLFFNCTTSDSEKTLTSTFDSFIYTNDDYSDERLKKAAALQLQSNKVSVRISKKQEGDVFNKQVLITTEGQLPNLFSDQEKQQLKEKFDIKIATELVETSSTSKFVSLGEAEVNPFIGLYAEVLKKRLESSPYFYREQIDYGASLVSDSSIELDENKKFETPIPKINLNPLLTKKQKSCSNYKSLDKRLINNINDLRDLAKKAAEKTCTPQIISPDGIKLSRSPSDMSNLTIATQMFLRIAAIEYNLRLLPLGNMVKTIDSDTFYEAIYHLFIKEIENSIGKQYTDIIFESLLGQYIEDEKLNDPKRGNESSDEVFPVYNSAKELLNSDKYKILSFIKYFKNAHFKKVNEQMEVLIKEYNLIPNIDKQYNNLFEYEYQKIINNASKITETKSSEIWRLKFNFTDIGVRTSLGNESGPQNLFSFQVKTDKAYRTIHESGLESDFKEFFKDFFYNKLHLQDVYESHVLAILFSTSSIGKINSIFNGSKFALKTVLDVMINCSDYTKKAKDTGFTAAMSRLKALAMVPEFMIKAMAESIDPNIKIANTLTMAYEMGAVAAEAAGVDVQPKKLPLFVTSPIVTAASLGFLPPLTPFGYAAIGLSLKELNIKKDNSLDNSDKSDKDC